MSETKYTKDGKKVAVLGKLNAEEYIVQEIFVVEGQEVPGGENFTAKGLLDKPGESWKEKNLRELEMRYEREKNDWDMRIEKQNARLSEAHEKAKLKANQLFAFADNAMPEQLQTLIEFLAGRIKYAFVDCTDPKIVSMDDNVFFDGGVSIWRKEVGDIKLLSLMGKSDGDLEFRLSDYGDGSGSNRIIRLARTYQEAVMFAQEKLNEQAEKYVERGGKGWMPFEYWEKIEGIQIPPEAQRLRKKHEEEERRAKIDKLRKELADLEAND